MQKCQLIQYTYTLLLHKETKQSHMTQAGSNVRTPRMSVHENMLHFYVLQYKDNMNFTKEHLNPNQRDCCTPYLSR